MNEELEAPMVLHMILARHHAWIQSLGTGVPSKASAELDRQTMISLWAATSADLKDAVAALNIMSERIDRAREALRQETPGSNTTELGNILDAVRAALRGDAP